MTTYLQEILLSTEPITAYTVELKKNRWTVVDPMTEEEVQMNDDQLLCVYSGNFFTLTKAQIELERQFAVDNNVEDRLEEMLSLFEEE